RTMPLPLSGLLVVSLEQAVAAPMCTCRLADAGARVIKVERPEGDFARYYDKLAVSRTRSAPSPPVGEGWGGGGRGGAPIPPRTTTRTANPSPQGGGEYTECGAQASITGEGQSAYFVWLNRGKESVVLDLARADDKALLAAILAKADVFVQNLKPGAIAKLG